MKSEIAKQYIINNLEIVKGCDELKVSSVTAVKACEIAENVLLDKIDMSIKNFERILELSNKLNTGNISHDSKVIAGIAKRNIEYLRNFLTF